jgi:hypothetical protein
LRYRLWHVHQVITLLLSEALQRNCEASGQAFKHFCLLTSGGHRKDRRVAADIVRIENGRLAEHWDVIENEATKAESNSGLPMFGDHFTT